MDCRAIPQQAPASKDQNAGKMFKKNIKDRDRNRKYNKIVHDTRNGGSLVFGLTDGIMAPVDEANCKWESWAVHDKDGDAKFEDIVKGLKKWPSANTKWCRYGLDPLHVLLPVIIESEQQDV